MGLFKSWDSPPPSTITTLNSIFKLVLKLMDHYWRKSQTHSVIQLRCCQIMGGSVVEEEAWQVDDTSKISAIINASTGFWKIPVSQGTMQL